MRKERSGCEFKKQYISADPRGRCDCFDPNGRVRRAKIGTSLRLLGALLSYERDTGTSECVCEVEFPERRGHVVDCMVGCIGVDEGRAFLPEPLNEPATIDIVVDI